MLCLPNDIETFVSLLQYRAKTQADEVLYRFLPDGEGDGITLSYKELDEHARQLASALLKKAEPGDRALLLYPDGLEFIKAFFGCLYAGIVAVPAYPPKRNQKMQRLECIIEDCSPALVLTELKTSGVVKLLFQQSGDRLIQSIVVTNDQKHFQAFDNTVERAVTANTLAFLQYTSGSTGNPKGVMVTHANLLANAKSFYVGNGHNADSVGVSWLPLFHDMGLIGVVLQSLYAGVPTVIMPPTAFLQKPLRWLQAISRFKGTSSGAPNFGYDLCVQSITPEEIQQLDLSHWKTATSGAEPVRAETLEAFSKLCAPAGFSPQAFVPCYGMAEATLIITSKPAEKAPVIRVFDAEKLKDNWGAPVIGGSSSAQVSLVSCGNAWDDHHVVIVDPDTCEEVAENRVGEIWFTGPSNTQGYWNKPELNQETLNASVKGNNQNAYLRTGDLGFMDNGELFVTGRLKDLIIINARNHYPQDIELTVANSHEVLSANATAAFSVDVDGKEKLVVVQELKRTEMRQFDEDAVFSQIRQQIFEHHEVQVHDIVLIRPAQLLKTSSGKVRRRACREAYENNALDSIATWRDMTGNKRERGVAAGGDSVTLAGEPSFTAPDGEAEIRLAKLWSAILGIRSISRSSNFFQLGGDSIKSVELAHAIEKTFGMNLSAAVLYEHPTLQTMAHVLTSGVPLTRVANLPEQVRLDPAIQPHPNHVSGAYRNIFLTGATGFLGAYLLNDLLNHTDTTIYCLVRAASPQEGMARLHAAFEQVGLSLEYRAERVVPIIGDLAEFRFGLDERAFVSLAEQIDAIIHCGAMVDWVRPYADLYGPNVTATHGVLRLASTAKTKPVHYVSTLWVFAADKNADKDYPGDIYYEHDQNPDWRNLETGYNQSKWVSEQLVYEAMRRGIPAVVYRMDLIIGSAANGKMKVTDFFPRIMRDVVELGVLPDEHFVADLVPVDYLSQMIVALFQWPESLGKTFHLSNPDRLTVASIVEILTEFGYAVERTPLDEWKRRVSASPANALYPLRDFLGMYNPEFIAINAKCSLDTRQASSALGIAAPGLVASIPSMKHLLHGMLNHLHLEGLISKRPRPLHHSTDTRELAVV